MEHAGDGRYVTRAGAERVSIRGRVSKRYFSPLPPQDRTTRKRFSPLVSLVFAADVDDTRNLLNFSHEPRDIVRRYRVCLRGEGRRGVIIMRLPKWSKVYRDTRDKIHITLNSK